MQRSFEAIMNGLLAFAAYIAVVVISSVAADYTYYRQTQAETAAFHSINDQTQTSTSSIYDN